MGLKRKHSLVITLRAWKVMDISLEISTAVKTGLSTLEIPHVEFDSLLSAGISAGWDFSLRCSGPG